MEKYELLQKIGRGSFGLIRKIKRKSDGKVCVPFFDYSAVAKILKILVRKEVNYNRMSTEEKKQLVSEVNILRELRHPNIVRYYERFVDRESGCIYLVMEYCGGGDLAQVIRKCSQRCLMTEELILDFFAQLLMALQYCHNPADGKQVILHRDIKPENVLIDDVYQDLKLGDFGLSRILGVEDFACTYVGTPYYMSPEIVNETEYSTKSDIWALGCLMYELCCLKPPFEAKTQKELNEKIKMGRVNRIPSQYSNELNQIIKSMLNVSPENRPSADQLINSYPKLKHFVLARRNKNLARELAKRELRVSQAEQELSARVAAFELKELRAYQFFKEKEAWLSNWEESLNLKSLQLKFGESSLKSSSPKSSLKKI